MTKQPKLVIGYKPDKRHRVKGISVLSKIKYSKLRFVAAGGSGVVITDGKYAIKIGYISRDDYNDLAEAAEAGFAQPVLYHDQNVEIDQRMVDIIFAADPRNGGAGGDDFDPDDFFKNDPLEKDRYIADIMVSLYVEPFLSPQEPLDDDDARSKAYKIATKVRDAYAKATKNYWSDSHPWNLGIYKGALIILDF